MLLSHGDSFIKMAVVRHLVFLKSRLLNCGYGSENQCASPCKILWRSLEPLRRYRNFSICKNGGRPIVGFLAILSADTVKRVTVRYHTMATWQTVA